jgi:hypothetical protein
MAGPTACEKLWTKNLESFVRHVNALIAANPKAKDEIGLAHTALIAIQQLIRTSPMAFIFVIPFYLQSVKVHSANCVKIYTTACRSELNSALQ